MKTLLLHAILICGLWVTIYSALAQTWMQTSAPTNISWTSIASSADGTRLVAVTSNDGIWTSQSTPTPQLNVLPINGNLALSWVLPSTSFGLQQSPELIPAIWMNVTNPPILNLKNLQEEVTLPVTNREGFCRLATQ